MMNFKMKNKTLFLCLPAMLNIPFGGSSAFGANSEKDNKENSPKRPNVLVLLTDDQTFSTIHAWVIMKFRLRIWTDLSIRVCHSPKLM